MGLLLGYGGVSLLCALELRRRIRRASAPFSATVEEFRRDQVAILRKTEEGA